MDDVIVCPFTVAIDRRENAPFHFSGLRGDAAQSNARLVVPTETKYLATGDYSIVGMEDRVAIERKNPADLFSSLGRDRARFEREVARLNEMEWAAVVAESDWMGIYARPPAKTRMTPKAVIRSILSWQQKYPTVHWILAPGRAFAEALCFRSLEKFHQNHRQETPVPTR